MLAGRVDRLWRAMLRALADKRTLRVSIERGCLWCGQGVPILAAAGMHVQVCTTEVSQHWM